MISLKVLKDLLPECCDVDSVDISRLSVNHRNIIYGFLPQCRSILILVHHIRHSLEWKWFQFKASYNGETAPADLHLESEAEQLIRTLGQEGNKTLLLPYPGKCGVRFKELADMSGLGKIGDSFLFLHRDWGPWVHLRIILTDVRIADTLPACGEVCVHCGSCGRSCPANAIKNRDFLGNDCNASQAEKGREIKGYTYKCEICLRVCPIGAKPEELEIKRSRRNECDEM